MARLLALCSLPRTNPKNRHEFKRVNGPYTLYMTATAGNKLPYGSLPRLLLAWVCTGAGRLQFSLWQTSRKQDPTFRWLVYLSGSS